MVALLKVPIIVVTLGTSAMISGLLLFIFGSTVIFNIPPSMLYFSKMAFGTVTTVDGISNSFHPSILIWGFLSILMYIFLKYTTFGKNIYAMGGDINIFERSGESRKRN